MALEFGAPWSRSLKTASRVSVGILIAVGVAGFLVVPAQQQWVRIMVVALPLLILMAALACMVSGYILTSTTLEVRRPFWNNSFALSELNSVAGDETALKGSLRLFGNGGLLSFSGVFWNRRLGVFHAYATDPGRAVVLKFRKRTIVITPDDTQHFIVRLRTHLANAERH